MSEFLKNRENKQALLKRLVMDLHKGRDFEEVKREFGELIKEVDATEIARMEQQLINEGMQPEEIKKMCNVHAAVFRDTLSQNPRPGLIPGHPLFVLKHENDQAKSIIYAIEKDIEEISEIEEPVGSGRAIAKLRENLRYFTENVDRHFSKKENIYFPYLEKHKITGPPSVMWSVDDEIRDMLKNLIKLVLLMDSGSRESLREARDLFAQVKVKLTEMIFKEEEILSPMMENTLSEEEWAAIKEQSSEFGTVFSASGPDLWIPEKRPDQPAPARQDGDFLNLDTGTLTPGQINAILTHLPLDITFVDKNDEVRYFSQGRERIFTRTKSIIGRKVQNCHPPESVHVVERIVSDFRSGKHSTAQFWLELNGSFIHIRYVALRDQNGDYMGTMEVSQNITGLRSLKGERRLLQYSQ
ncbi:MAG: DUF438 domain-containing protein [Desulfocucumaceae bacterium]